MQLGAKQISGAGKSRPLHRETERWELLCTPSHIKAPTPSGAGLSNGPTEDARGRESAETLRAFRPADPAARHSLREGGAGSSSGHLTERGGVGGVLQRGHASPRIGEEHLLPSDGATAILAKSRTR